MLTIRDSQLQILRQQPREQFVDDMLAHLYSYFPAIAWLLTPDELRYQVNTIIERAAVYQLTSRQQVCRFINLAAAYGWEFDGDPNLLWMRSILTDTSLPQPSERIDRLVQTCLHRQRIEEHNQALHQQLGLAPVVTPRTPEFEFELVEDYAGHDRNANTQSTAASTGKKFPPNPLSHHLSQSLWHNLEAVPSERLSLATFAWVNNTPALLCQKSGGCYVAGK